MSTCKEIINGHDCRFEIYGNNQNNQFTGKANINDPCISQKLFEIPEDTRFPTENAVKQLLKDKITKFLQAPDYLHPRINSKPQPIGATCNSCKRIVSKDDGWKDVY